MDVAVPLIVMLHWRKLKRSKSIKTYLLNCPLYGQKMKWEVILIVIGGVGCVTAMPAESFSTETQNQFCTLELLQQIAVLGSSYVLCNVQLIDRSY